MELKYAHVLWDFNGTILDDVALNFRLMNELLVSRGKTPLADIGYYRSIFGFPVRDYYSRAGLALCDAEYAEIADFYTDRYYKEAGQCPLREHIYETLLGLRAFCIKQYILSASQYSSLPPLLNKLCIAHFFDTVLGDLNAFANGKVDIGIQWLNRSGIDPDSILLIGDTVHDKQTAEAMGIDCLLLAGGHQSEDALLATGVRVIASPAEILTLIKTGL